MKKTLLAIDIFHKFLSELSSSWRESTNYTLGHVGVALLMFHTFKIKDNTQNYFLLGGTEDLRCLLPHLTLANDGDHAFIWMRTYIHSEFLYLRNIHGALHCFWFDPQAWGVRYYPNRNILEVLRSFNSEMEIIKSGLELQDKEGSGTCEAHIYHVMSYVTQHAETFFASLQRYSPVESDIFFKVNEELNTKVTILNHLPAVLENFSEKTNQVEKFKQKMHKKFSHEILPRYFKKNGEFNWKKIISISHQLSGSAYLLEGSDSYDPIYRLEVTEAKDKACLIIRLNNQNQLKFGNFFSYSSATYPVLINKENSHVVLDGKVNEEQLTVEWIANDLNELFQKFKINESDVYFKEGMRQLLAFKSFIRDAQQCIKSRKLKTEDSIISTQKAQLLSLMRCGIANLIAELLKIDEKSVGVDFSFALDSLDGVQFDSLSLTQLAENINFTYGTKLTPIVFFRNKTLTALCNFLHEKYFNQFFLYYQSALSEKHHSVVDDFELDDKLVAIIGASGVFPGAADLEAFWQHLENEAHLITEVPCDRWNWREYYGNPHQEKNKTNIKWGGFIEGVNCFDAEFFGLSDHEAILMDPQQRVFLETVWKTIEDAGYKISELSGAAVGVFVGAGSSEYFEKLQLNDVSIEEQTSTGRSNAILANRISYLFNFIGSSESIDAGCAGSLLAIRHAVEQIQQGECDLAIAGAVHTILSPSMHIAFSKGGVLSETGQCRSFDKEANGYVRSEGVGAVLLKPLKKAIADHDHIYAVIRGIEVNHSGRSNAMTSPSPVAQEKLLIKSYTKAKINPLSISYIETHGSATKLGDPIEVMALNTAFESLINDASLFSQFRCGIGSVKTNIGHAEEASGMASIFKVVLGMKYKKIPANIHFNELNPLIEKGGTPFYVVEKTINWKPANQDESSYYPRRAGVSCFSFGGVNAHIILEEVELKNTPSVLDAYLIILSAKNESVLKLYAQKLIEFLAHDDKHSSLVNLAYTLQVGREAMPHRLAIVVDCVETLKEKLSLYCQAENHIPHLYSGNITHKKRQVQNDEIKNQTLDSLAKQWVEGAQFDWNLLYAAARPHRISLPTYPFLRKNFDQLSFVYTQKTHVANREEVLEDDLNSCVYQLIERQAKKTPDAIAVRFEMKCLSYKELVVQVNALANHLLGKGIKNQAYVGIFMDRSLDMLISLLAVMKSGNIYIPLDTTFPKERIAYILQDTGLSYLITQPAHLEQLSEVKCHFIFFDQEQAEIKAQAEKNLLLCAEGTWQGNREDIAYILYTSGSTGKPKGVEVYHRGLTNILCSMRKSPGFNAQDYLLAITTLCFDIAGLELYLPLISGGTLEIVPEHIVKDGSLLKEKIDHSPATIMQATPATWHMLLSSDWCGKENFKILCGGEALTHELATRLLTCAKEVWNLYGPTETTIWSAISQVKKDERINIGNPISNTKIYILNDDLKPVSLGDSGEIYIGGEGVAKGYLNRPELTAEKFISNPFDVNDKKKIYRTGDRGCYQKDGSIVYQGRMDHQVKLRGYRIELGEIENLFYTLFNVESAVAVLRNAATIDQSYLAIFYVLKNDFPLLEKRLIVQTLKQYLPDYMIPVAFVQLKSLPLTLNTKVDRKILATEDIDQLKLNYATIDSVTTEKIEVKNNFLTQENIQSWVLDELSKILIKKFNVDSIDPNATFSEYGANSILYTQLSIEINKRFFTKIKALEFFKYTYASALASHLLTRYPDECGQAFAAEREDNEPIAIIGMYGRLPQSPDLIAFWENLIANKNLITEIPTDRWEHSVYFGDPLKNKNKTNSKWGGFISDIDCFDASFFGISPREAELMDPRQRLVIEAVWKTFECAGYKTEDFSGSKTGLFIGAIGSDYGDLQRQLHIPFDGYSLSGYANTMIANRASFLFNLKGPSEVIDTACSSSLVAIHAAVSAIKNKQCEVAIAGGVNLILHPNLYIALSQNGMLSSDGQCKTFDKSANGYVRGEGIGTILLKPLKKAIQDNDQIYALIRGQAVNHGGKANSLTAPNPDAQIELLTEAYSHAEIDPSTITFIETHGTGTKIGDPIEIDALNSALAQASSCALGALKTNIGHLEAAAGVAGILKIILSMRIGILPANVNFFELNPYVHLDHEKFYLLNKNQVWERRQDIQGRILPRRAGISSFGFGGVNAHIILEEYISEKPSSSLVQENIIVLSAHNKDNLVVYAKELLAYFKNKERQFLVPADNLTEIAFTLQVGRTPMKERLAIVSNSLNDTIEKLEAFVEQNLVLDNVYCGNANTHPNQLDVALMKTIDARQLASMWVTGMHIDWQCMYSNMKIKRIYLPTYPFTKERYWLRQPNKEISIELKNSPYSLSALIDKNSSTSDYICFTKELLVTEYYLADHMINSKYILPAVVCIEMARMAGSQANQASKVIGLKNMVWMRPIIVGKLKEISIELHQEKESARFVIYSQNEVGEKVDHVQGIAIYGAAEHNIKASIESINVNEIKQRCGQQWERKDFYAELKKLNYQYGESFQSIRELYLNHHEVLARIVLPEDRKSDFSAYQLHPSLMEGALQTLAGLLFKRGSDDNIPFLPFSIKQLDIYDSLPQSIIVYLRSDLSEASIDQKYQIILADENGNVLIKIKDYTVRPIQQAVVTEAVSFFAAKLEKSELSFAANIPLKDDIVLLVDDQNVLELDQAAQKIINASSGNYFNEISPSKFEICLEQEQSWLQLFERLNSLKTLPNKIIYHCNNHVEQRFLNKNITALFHLLKALVQQKPQFVIQFYCIYLKDEADTVLQYRALTGMFKTVQREYPKIQLHLIERNSAVDGFSHNLLRETNSVSQNEVYIKYDDGVRYVEKYDEIFLKPTCEKLSLREKGIYLITGGAGGLGLVMAKYLAECKANKIILVGRGLLTAQTQKRIDDIMISTDADIIYLQADVTQYDEVSSLISQIKKNFGLLNGVIHCAGKIMDNYLIKKKFKDFEEVCKPKILGAVNLDLILQHEDLDFFILFSSISSVLGSVGQIDYAYANAFLDHFAAHREYQREHKLRQGKTLAINWSLWSDGGMQVDEAISKSIQQQFGIIPLEKNIGCEAFAAVLKTTYPQVVVATIKDKRKVEQALNIVYSAEENTGHETTTKNEMPNELFGLIKQDLLTLTSEILQLETTRIDFDKEMGSYGFDSISFTELTNKINEIFSTDLTPAILFEIEPPTLHGFIHYLLVQNSEALLQYYKKQNLSAHTESVETSEPMMTEHNPIENAKILQHEPIAIIGMSGVMPQSKDLAEFWSKLIHGENCITEVPEDRWDWEKYYSHSAEIANKTVSKWGGFMTDVDKFDAKFFGVSEEEAVLMDPQQRIYLEQVWAALEHAGYHPKSLSGANVGVYVGITNRDYADVIERVADKINVKAVFGNAPAFLPNRISYFLNLHGPSEAVDTLCSSSLVAIHRAVEDLRVGNCAMAITGGVSVIASPRMDIAFTQAGMLSKEGKCKSFDKNADGFVRGEGAGVLILKLLSQAKKDKDYIYATIQATGVNHGGHANSLTAPNAKAQTQLLMDTYRKSGIDPATVSYIEAHATGTSLGDAVEINGLKKIFTQTNQSACCVGCVKTNIGHLEAAAGIAGVLKVLLAFKHKKIPPIINWQEMNPYINLKDSSLYLVKEAKEWTVDATGKAFSRRAGVNSFGAGGTNAHIILEEYIMPTQTEPQQDDQKQREPLSPYQFTKNRYWIDEKFFQKKNTVLPLPENENWNFHYDEPYLRDHRVYGQQVLLGVTYASITLELIKNYRCPDQAFVEIQNLFFVEPVILNRHESVTVSVAIENNMQNEMSTFQINCCKSGTVESKKTAVGRYLFHSKDTIYPLKILNISKCINEAGSVLQGEYIYEVMSQKTVTYGESLKTIHQAYFCENHVLGELRLTDQMLDKFKGFYLNPAMLDGAILCGVFQFLTSKTEPFIPTMVKKIQVYHPLPNHCFCYSNITKENEEILMLNIELYDEKGNILVSLKDVICKRAKTEKILLSGNENLNLEEIVSQYLTQKISLLLAREINLADKAANFMHLGLDSSSLVAFTNTLAEELNIELFPTLFFEYQNIYELTKYFITEHKKACRKIFLEGHKLNNLSSTEEVSHKPITIGTHENTNEDIAIIGVSGIFPHSENLDEFWQHLVNGDDLVTEIPGDRWDWRAYDGDPVQETNKTYAKWGSFLNDVDKFDPSFFNISPREAELMDPKQRIFLQLVWSLIEDAGYSIKNLKASNTGLFVGMGALEYGNFNMDIDKDIEAYSATGIANCILPNRISYLFGFHGPSEPVDTACSSSLVAIHRAIESIRNGECDQVIAGGINLILSPFLHIAFSKSGMLSKTGKCKTFDRAADGYVRGEGAGAILLKPLSKAIADHDHIYAVIKGSAINHGGYSNTLTAPNPKAQAELLETVYQKAGIHPTTLSYIEAHGTGTELGDPVELTALKNVFDKFVDHNEKFCGLGSVKTNIGHLEAAAGIASVIKVLLALKHKKLPATVNFKELNPYIQISDSNFYIVEKTMPWNRLSIDGQSEVPRRAGISSFGFGGVNAHIVIEEYRANKQEEQEKNDEFIFVLSAKNPDALKRNAKNMLEFLQQTNTFDHEKITTHLMEVMYTLQMGREAMSERLAIVASNYRDLVKKLAGFYFDEKNIARVYQSPEKSFNTNLTQSECDKAAVLWCSGVDVDWSQFYQGKLFYKTSLPTYSFSKERYWNKSFFTKDQHGFKAMHPLIDRVVPVLRDYAVQYEKFFLQHDLIIFDHKVGDTKILPAAGHLEIAYQIFSQLKKHQRIFKLSDIIFHSPLSIDEDKMVTYELAQEKDNYQFRIFSYDQGNLLLHSSGKYLLGDEALIHEASFVNLAKIKERCGLKIEQATLYKKFHAAGIYYGPFFESVKWLSVNQEEALGFIVLPDQLRADFYQYHFHPSTLDGVLQVVLGYIVHQAVPQAALPFAIDEFEIFGPLETEIYAYVKVIQKNQFNVVILNKEGKVLIKISQLVAREARQIKEVSNSYFPHWDLLPEATSNVPKNNKENILIFYQATTNKFGEQLISMLDGRVNHVTSIQIDPDAKLSCMNNFESYLQKYEHVTIYFLAATNHPDEVTLLNLENIHEEGLLFLFDLVKIINLPEFLNRTVNLVVMTHRMYQVSPNEQVNPCYASLSGFVKSIAQEFSNLHCQLIDLDLERSSAKDFDLLSQLLLSDVELPITIAMREGRFYQQHLLPIQLQKPDSSTFRYQGVYIILGGAGGIGLELGLYLAKQVKAKLVLLGRSVLTIEQQQKIDHIKKLGGEAIYYQADATDLESIREAVRITKERFGYVNGFIHSALVLNDMLVSRMSRGVLTATLDPKVKGSIILAQALQAEALDFMLFFSSSLSFAGNAGQSNYAAACTFEDAYALYLNHVMRFPVKVINWGYWGEVGVVSSENYKESLVKKGFQSISVAEGFSALERALASSFPQIVIIKADQAILKSIGVNDEEHKAETSSQADSILAKISHGIQAYIDTIPRSVSTVIVDGFKLFEEYCQYSLYEKFLQMDLFNQRSQVVPAHERLITALLNIFKRIGVEKISEKKSELSVTISELRLKLVNSFPEIQHYLKLVDACLAAYPEIFSGEKNYLDIMFPNGSMKLVEKIYTDSQYADCYNKIVAEIIRQYLQVALSHNSQRKIKILEIGAGTGGTTEFVLNAIKPYWDNIIYVYTDISLRFIKHYQEKCQDDYPFIEFQKLDLEQDCTRQKVDLGGVDIILGTNVIHATKNIENTLIRLKALLKKNGLLIINETVQRKDFATISFGLTKGWWLYSDTQNRIDDSPIVSQQTWQQLLSYTGFKNIYCFDLPGVKKPEAWQNVIVAENSGFEATAERLSNENNCEAKMKSQDMTDSVRAYIKDTFAKILKINPEKIDDTSTFENYGVDSLISIEIRNQFEKDLNKLPATLLFDHNNINALARYLIEKKSEFLSRKLNRLTESNGIMIDDIDKLFEKKLADQNEVQAIISPAVTSSVKEIAIIGLSGRYPMAADLDAFLENLRLGKNCINEVPSDRWNWELASKKLSSEKKLFQAQWAGFIEGVDQFDPLFFNISPAEAQEMDPQERIILELAWQVLEDGGYLRNELLVNPKKAGVYIGAMNQGYEWLSAAATIQGIKNHSHSRFWSIANRVSYYFNLQGPSMAVDTACSASFTAIHLACQAIRSGECEFAIAGGVNLILHPEHLQRLFHDKLLTTSRQSQSFGAEADGFVDGEGAGLILLKSLEQAKADGNVIYAVIKGSSINAGGKTSGYLTPNSHAQADVFTQAAHQASVPLETISYIETAAAGSLLGDAIEASGLNTAFKGVARTDRCAIGSVKSNIGHLEAASGIAALTKVLLQMKHHELFPSIHCASLNSEIDWVNSPFYVQTKLVPWPDSKTPRRAGINSFGAGGANAHLIIEEYQEKETASSPTESSYSIIVLSAKNKQSLQNYIAKLIHHILYHSLTDQDLIRMAYTLQVSRTPLEERVVFVVSSMDQLLSLLKEYAENPTDKKIHIEEAVAENFNIALEIYQWSNGQQVDWKKLYRKPFPLRISLPGYSFLKQRYWIENMNNDTLLFNEVLEATSTGIEKINSSEDFVDKSMPKNLERLQLDLLKIVSAVLKIDLKNLFIDDDIGQYGLDSIRVTQFIEEINQKYQLKLTPAAYYGHASIAQFAQALHSQFRKELAEFYQAPQTKIAAQVEETTCLPTPNISAKNLNREPIAIVGIAGVFPQAENLEEFWRNLIIGRDVITAIPKERWDWQEFSQSQTENTGIKWGAFLQHIAQFDPGFFGISPREACLMDPQHRIFLEVVWKAIEDSGYCPLDLWGTKTALYVGVASTDYMSLLRNTKMEAHSITGNAHSILANRISYLLNLKGPSEPVDTACSSSLVAIHKAVESIWNGACEFAIAGGVNSLISPELYQSFEDAGMLSADGKCMAFDERANGYVRGEGAGAVFLMPLSQAEKNKMPIYALIKSAALNHGGHTSSLTAPNPIAQQELLTEVYQQAGFDPATITYIESHGTGTKLGDPIEINALKAAFAELYQKHGHELSDKKHCAIGALKSNIGHLETAAGIAGMLKIVLAMKHKMIPGNLHFNQLNPYVQLENSPFYICDNNTPWHSLIDESGKAIPRRAGVSSFGFGGVNAHVVLEEYVQQKKINSQFSEQLVGLPFSAENQITLKKYVSDFYHFVKNSIEDQSLNCSLEDIAFTLQTGRLAMKERVIFFGKSINEFLEKINLYLQSEENGRGNFIAGSVNDQRKFQSIGKVQKKFDDRFPRLMQLKNIEEMGNQWINGEEIYWHALYSPQKLPCRVSLPPYPFSKQDYWLTQLFVTDNLLETKKTKLAENQCDETLAFSHEKLVLENSNHALEEKITMILGSILSINSAEIIRDINFLDLGLDSIMGIKLIKELNKICSTPQDPKHVFENPTVQKLANYLMTEAAI